MPDAFEVQALLPATPALVYAAWLDGPTHAEMTGADAQGFPVVGSRFTAWDGYITGSILELTPDRRIVQAWRTSEFPDDAADSRLEIELNAEGDGTRITLRHSNIPTGQGASYQQGWVDHYFAPMTEHFGG